MKLPSKSAFAIASIPAGLLLIFFIASAVQTCRQVRSIEQKVNQKFENLSPPPTVITAYDIATSKALDSIENRRKAANLLIDGAAVSDLQSLLDSVYNFPGHAPAYNP